MATLRAQISNQHANEVRQGINDVNGIVSGVANIKAAYDNSFYSKINDNTSRLLEEYRYEIDMCNDPEQMSEIQARYESQINGYISEIKAPRTVQSKWNETVLPNLKSTMENYKRDAQVPMMWNTVVATWEDEQGGIITKIGSDSTKDYSAKKAELYQSYTSLGLSNAPKKYVGEVTTPEMALENMQEVCVTQYVDRYYAPLKNNAYRTGSEFDAFKLAEEAVNDLENQMGTKLDDNTRAMYVTSALKQIDTYEKLAQRQVEETYSKMEKELSDIVWQEGAEVTASDILSVAASYGAFEADGSVNKYWQPLLSQYEKIAQAESQYKTAQANVEVLRNLTSEDWHSVVNEILGAKEVQYATELGAVKKETVVPEGVSSVITEDGTVLYSPLTSKEATYKFSDGSTEKTIFSPVVDKMAEKVGITDKTSLEYKALVQQVNALSEASNIFTDTNQTSLVDFLQKAKASGNLDTATLRHVVLSKYATKELSLNTIKNSSLFDPTTPYDNLDSETQAKLNNALQSKLKISWYGPQNKVSKDNKTIDDDNYLSALQEAQQMLEISYNLDPQGFITNQDKILKEIADSVGSKATQELVAKALKKSTAGWINPIVSGLSENVEVQKITQGLYAPGDYYDEKTGKTNYIDYTAHLVPRAVDAAKNYVDLSTQDKTNSFKKSIAQEQVATALSGGSKNYSELGPGDKTTVDICILKALYERDARQTLVGTINESYPNLSHEDIDKEAIFVRIKGYGVGLIYDGKVYASDGDPKTSKVFQVPGTIKDETMERIQKTTANEDPVINETDILWGSKEKSTRPETNVPDWINM